MLALSGGAVGTAACGPDGNGSSSTAASSSSNPWYADNRNFLTDQMERFRSTGRLAVAGYGITQDAAMSGHFGPRPGRSRPNPRLPSSRGDQTNGGVTGHRAFSLVGRCSTSVSPEGKNTLS
ncbi:hypothetical protein GCM10023195_51100 [Actinoallomurus liliacearum]|uniref:Uncharacterized protein n=1 Tax=Actinoallomurus liliacearum TaxID=1080073 RepID=A0ABP8TQ92_9ACTN